MREYVVPHLKALREEKPSSRYKPTGSVSEKADTSGRDMRGDIDWPAVEKASRWPNLKSYFECFGDHPTWGNEEGDTVVETGLTDDEASKHVDDVVVSKQTSAVPVQVTPPSVLPPPLQSTPPPPALYDFDLELEDDD